MTSALKSRQASSRERHAEATAKALAEAPNKGRNEAPAEASGKALVKASVKAPDPQQSGAFSKGPDLGPAKPKVVAPNQELAEPNQEPTNQ